MMLPAEYFFLLVIIPFTQPFSTMMSLASSDVWIVTLLDLM